MNVTRYINSKNRTAREAWLEARRSCVGASESPSILGVGYSGSSPWTVWHDKVFGGEERETPFSWEIGRQVQDTIGRLYAKQTGNPFSPEPEYCLSRHEEHGFIACSIDGWTSIGDDTPAPIEIKNVGEHASDEWGSCPACGGEGCPACGQNGKLAPLKYVVQVQHQLLVTGAPYGVLCALIGGNRIEYRHINRDEAFLAALLAELTRFWRLVESKTPPPIDASDAAREALHAMYPRSLGTCIALPTDALDWVAELERAKADAKDAETRKVLCENHIKNNIGEAEYGALPDGRFVRWERTEIAESTVTRSAHTRHMLRVVKKPKGAIEYVNRGN